MTKTFSAGWIALIGIVVLFLVVIMAYVSTANAGNRFEQGIKFSHEQSRNVLGQYAPRLKEALGVTKIQASAVSDVITGANESRYGKTGSQATVQWIREQNPNLDQSGYARILDIVESGRNDFQKAQEDKLDRIRAYDTARGNMPGSFFYSMAGYPTAAYVAADYSKLVISGHAGDAFATGRDDGVDLNGI